MRGTLGERRPAPNLVKDLPFISLLPPSVVGLIARHCHYIFYPDCRIQGLLETVCARRRSYEGEWICLIAEVPSILETRCGELEETTELFPVRSSLFRVETPCSSLHPIPSSTPIRGWMDDPQTNTPVPCPRPRTPTPTQKQTPLPLVFTPFNPRWSPSISPSVIS